MSDEPAHDADADHEAPPEDEDPVWNRTTAPQSRYTTREVGLGLAAFAVLAVVAFGLPLALA